MPIYEYLCPNGHKHERLRKMEEREDEAECIYCYERALPIISLPHCLPDGVYSYAPNIGDPNTHERRTEIVKKRNEATKHGEPWK